MQKHHHTDLLTGLFLLLAMVSVLFVTIQSNQLFSRQNQGNVYNITAKFSDIGSLKVQAPVKIAGVKVGEVESIQLDGNTFEAEVGISIHDHVNLPSDSSIVIITEGLLGNRYLIIKPGYASDYWQQNEIVTNTQSALLLEETLTKVIALGAQHNE